MKKTVFLMLIVVAFIGCTSKNETSFEFKNYEGKFLVLNNRDTLLSGNVTKASNVFKFKWTKEFKNPYMVSIRLEDDYRGAYSYFEKGKYTITTDGSKINVSSETNDKIAQVERAIEEAPQIIEIQNIIAERTEKKNKIEASFKTIKDKKSQADKDLTNEWVKAENARRQSVKDFKKIKSDIVYSLDYNLPLCIYLMKNRYSYIYDVKSGEKVVEIAKTVDSKESTDFTKRMLEGFSGMLKSEQQKELTKVGNQYTDLVANDLKGNPIKLSEVVAKNKIVLIKFWASWCGPCVRSIPETLELTEKYGKKGFQVYAISLDSKKKAWEKAINKHKISGWVNVSELSGWDGKEHHKYGVTGVPKEVLISGEGKIMGVNLRKAWLDRYVKEACK